MKELEEAITKAIACARNVVPTREHSLVLTKLQEAFFWFRASPASIDSLPSDGLPMTSERFNEIRNYVWERDRPLTFVEAQMLVELACECERARRAGGT